MPFFLTTYIHPLKSATTLSDSLKITIDNPRTEDEISVVERHIEVSMYSPDEMYKYKNRLRIPLNSDGYALGFEEYLRNFYRKNSSEPVVAEYEAGCRGIPTLRQIAGMWVILRYDDEGEMKELREIAEKEITEESPGFFLLDEHSPVEIASSRLVEYTYLLSLLVTEGSEYFGENFLIHDSFRYIYEPGICAKLNNTLILFALSTEAASDDDELRWKIDLPFIFEKIKEMSALIEETLTESSESRQKLLYVSSLLKIASGDITDENYKLVTYVSILEMLLTHNPNFMRYNIEDSINKQFQLKVATLVYLSDNRSQPVSQIQRRLKTIYQQRSNIAHGNFGALAKFKNALSKNEGDEEYFDDLIGDTIKYIRVVVNEYLKDSEFMEFLKES